jgi:hypothetical protein
LLRFIGKQSEWKNENDGMLVIKCWFPIFMLLSIHGFSQSYERYYNLTDLGRYHYRLQNLEMADSCFNQAFQEFVGFENDYFFALNLKKKLHNSIDTNLVVSMIECRVNILNYRYNLEHLGIQDDIYFKKLYKKHRPKKTLRGHRFSVLMLRDHRSRSKHFRWMAKNVDSKNAVKLQKLISRKPELFDRNRIGWYATDMLEILLMHQGNWDDAQLIFYDVRKFVAEGKIERHVLLSMLHRSSLFNGVLFKYDENTDSLFTTTNDSICGNRIFYNNVYGRELMIFRDGVYYLQPIHPSLDTTDVNRLRKFIFQADIKTAFPDSVFVFCTEEEFCGLLNK